MKTLFLLITSLLFLQSFAQQTEIENLGDKINTQYDELAPIISADGKRLYFVRKNHPSNTLFGKEEKTFDIWYSDLDAENKWTEAVHEKSPLNTNRSNEVIWVSPDKNRILIRGYFENGTPKGNGISLCEFTSKGWSAPKGLLIKNLKELSKGKQSSYNLVNDGKVLILSISEIKGSDVQNLYVSFLLKDNSWSQPKSMGKIFESATITYETPFVASDGKTLYFSSDRPGGIGKKDIWKTTRLDDTWTNWSEPVNLGAPVNTKGNELFFSLDATGDYAYAGTTSNSKGLCDVVKIKMKQETKPEPVVLIYGNVFNAKTKEPVGASLTYEILPEGKSAGVSLSRSTDGSYKIVLPYGNLYSFMAVSPDFISESDNIDLTKISDYKEIKKDLFLKPIERGTTVRLNNIFFDFGKADLRPESYPELDRLVKLLEENPKIEIEVGGHTDNKGDDALNMKLSNDRAAIIRDYLFSKGLKKSRITSKGFGKTVPLATNDTDEGRQINRRVEFIILKK